MIVNYIIIALVSFLAGIIVSFVFFKTQKENNALIIMLNDFRRTIEEFKNQNIQNTKEVNLALEKTSELAKVLTTNQNLKGQFGEDCLEAVIKTCFPNQNINYIKQFETVNSDDRRIKPDYLIKLPNDKSILIDCKLNLEKYIEYVENKDNEVKKAEFIKDINATINNLANKKYETSKEINQPDFILMYIPLEPVLTTIYTDKDFLGIIKNANEKNIILTGNSSIITTLRLTKLLWAQDSREKNIENIVNCAQNIYEYIALHTSNLSNIKKQLDLSYQNFNKEYEKMISNKLFQNIEQLKSYGIQSSSKKTGRKISEITIEKEFLQ